MPTTIAVGGSNVAVMLSSANYKQYRDNQVDKACTEGLHLAAEVAIAQAKGYNVTSTTTEEKIKLAHHEEIIRQRSVAIALVKEETEKYDIAIGQEIDGSTE